MVLHNILEFDYFLDNENDQNDIIIIIIGLIGRVFFGPVGLSLNGRNERVTERTETSRVYYSIAVAASGNSTYLIVLPPLMNVTECRKG